MGVTKTGNTKFGGYGAAAEVDEMLSEWLEKFNVTNENWLEWKTLLRTVQTSLDLIETKVTEIGNKRKDGICPTCGAEAKG